MLWIILFQSIPEDQSGNRYLSTRNKREKGKGEGSPVIAFTACFRTDTFSSSQLRNDNVDCSFKQTHGYVQKLLSRLVVNEIFLRNRPCSTHRSDSRDRSSFVITVAMENEDVSDRPCVCSDWNDAQPLPPTSQAPDFLPWRVIRAAAE